MRSYKYKRYMRDGTTQERTAVVRSRTERRQALKQRDSKRNIGEELLQSVREAKQLVA